MKKKILLVLITVALIGIIVFSIIIMKSKKAGNTPPTNNNPNIHNGCFLTSLMLYITASIINTGINDATRAINKLILSPFIH